MSPSPSPLSCGLVGAGPWATKAYAPMLAAGPETRLTSVWARRREPAHALASAHGAEAVESFDLLLERCDAVAFAVPPDVQADLATRAAQAGRHLMLEKPLALTLEGARRLAGVVEGAAVVSQLMLTHRFRPLTQAFLDQAQHTQSLGARLAFISSAFVRGPYTTSWRREHGVIHDFGPHAFDLLEATLGPIGRVTGRGDPRRWVTLICEHQNGAISELTMSGIVDLPRSVFRIELYGPEASLELDLVQAARDEPWSLARRKFAEAVQAGRSTDLDVRRGLMLQELIDQAMRAVAQ